MLLLLLEIIINLFSLVCYLSIPFLVYLYYPFPIFINKTYFLQFSRIPFINLDDEGWHLGQSKKACLLSTLNCLGNFAVTGNKLYFLLFSWWFTLNVSLWAPIFSTNNPLLLVSYLEFRKFELFCTLFLA